MCPPPHPGLPHPTPAPFKKKKTPKNCDNSNIQRLKGQCWCAHLNVREEHLEHVGAGVPGVEEHELGLLQVVGGKPFLNVQMSGLRKSSRALSEEQTGFACHCHHHYSRCCTVKANIPPQKSQFYMRKPLRRQSEQRLSLSPKPRPTSSFRCKRVRDRLHGTYKYSGKHF